MAFGNSTMGRTQVQLRYKRFKEGQEDVNDDARPSRPDTLTTDENINEVVKKKIFDNRRITVTEVADDVGISFGLCQAINVCSRHETRGSGDYSKMLCMNIAQGMLTTFKDDPDLLKRVIHGDESWLYGYRTLKPKPNPPNRSIQNSQDRKKLASNSVKY